MSGLQFGVCVGAGSDHDELEMLVFACTHHGTYAYSIHVPMNRILKLIQELNDLNYNCSHV